MNGRRPALLFVCVENSNRSQMAEAFARMHGGDRIEAWSAGSRPSGVINAKAVAAMRERGVDLGAHHSKGIADLPDRDWDHVVTMGCGDECPNVRGRQRTDWPLPDPRHMGPDDFNRVRDEVESRVLELLKDIEREGALL